MQTGSIGLDEVWLRHLEDLDSRDRETDRLSQLPPTSEHFPLSSYLNALRSWADQHPGALRCLIEATPYLARLERALEVRDRLGDPTPLKDVVEQRRLERRWLAVHLGRREFKLRRKDGAFRELFGWPKGRHR